MHILSHPQLFLQHIPLTQVLNNPGPSEFPRSPHPGYGVQDFTWEMDTTPGGPTVLLNGTVQEIYAELLKINPSYDGDFAETLAAAQAAAETETQTETEASTGAASLHKRLPVTCNNYDQAITRRIREGITYLRGVSGRPTHGPGPGNCGRVSCSYNSATWWCNENTSPNTLPGFNNIADGAQVVLNHSAPTDIYISGEEDHADKWRAVVRRSPC
ncbi:hypothetical protein BDW60DRAFT_32823 [Aspergillus nidulans var. acristatus]